MSRIWYGGLLSGGICPGLYVRGLFSGVFVRGVFVLEP